MFLYLDVPEKTQKRKRRKDPSSDHKMVETISSVAEKNPSLSERDIEDITDKLEHRMFKRLKDTEHSLKEILRPIENLSTKVGNLSSSSLEQ